MTAPTTPNAALAYRTLDHIDAHPEDWSQVSWCGTSKCFAGWAAELSGERPDGFGRVGGVHVGERAAQLLGFRDGLHLQEVGFRVVYPGAQYVGVVDDGADRFVEYDLFSACNSREDLGRLVAEIFGPRPGPAACPNCPPGHDCERGDYATDDVIIVDHGPVKPPYGTPEREAYDREHPGGATC